MNKLEEFLFQLYTDFCLTGITTHHRIEFRLNSTYHLLRISITYLPKTDEFGIQCTKLQSRY